MTINVEEAKFFWRGYDEWNFKRIKKIHSLIKTTPRTVLDMGCGHGLIGKSFEDLGCEVTYADIKDQRSFESKGIFKEFDADSYDWSCIDTGQYDLVLNLGLLYHTINPYFVARRTLTLTKIEAFIETEVHFGGDISWGMIEPYDQGNFIDRAKSKIGIRPNQRVLEDQFDYYRVRWKRYDDEDLNHDIHKYSWNNVEYPKDLTDLLKMYGYRRFYHITGD
jgi:SAM-dependent methyltransferase